MGAVDQAWDAKQLGVAAALHVIRPEVSADPYAARDASRDSACWPSRCGAMTNVGGALWPATRRSGRTLARFGDRHACYSSGRLAPMRFAILGSGAVGGYYGARLARAGHDVTFVARGAHLAAIRERGLRIHSPLGDFTIEAPAEDDTSRLGPVDVVIVAVKAYDNASALPMIGPMLGDGTTVLTVQNGVDSVSEIAAIAGEARTLGGTTYIATALEAPGVIVQTGTHRRIVFGEVFGDLSKVSDRVTRVRAAMREADIEADAVADGRIPIWEKFIFLATLAGFTGAARLPIGPVWADPFTRARFLEAAREIERIARAEGIAVASDVVDRIAPYVEGIPGSMRSSLLIDLSQGKRIEVEALQGAVVRRGARLGLPTPIIETLYAVLKLHAAGDAKAGQSQLFAR